MNRIDERKHHSFKLSNVLRPRPRHVMGLRIAMQLKQKNPHGGRFVRRAGHATHTDPFRSAVPVVGIAIRLTC
jgi:hypothetical protein